MISSKKQAPFEFLNSTLFKCSSLMLTTAATFDLGSFSVILLLSSAPGPPSSLSFHGCGRFLGKKKDFSRKMSSQNSLQTYSFLVKAVILQLQELSGDLAWRFVFNAGAVCEHLQALCGSYIVVMGHSRRSGCNRVSSGPNLSPANS
ncbi:hypothetical protein V6N13_048983 [Hibiscus sabdariffa]